MTSGKPKKPKQFTCITCGTTAEHYGNSRKMYCSPRCKYPNRYTTKPRLTTEQKAENRRARQRAKYARQRNIVRQYKLNAKHCADCHMEINETTIVCIDLDHRNPTEKTFTIAYKLAHITDAALIAELNKCDAVCRNCHAYRTHNGNHWHNRYTTPKSNR